MSFYGLSTLQKNNFELASKLFVTAKKSRHPIGCLLFFCLNSENGGFEPPKSIIRADFVIYYR